MFHGSFHGSVQSSTEVKAMKVVDTPVKVDGSIYVHQLRIHQLGNGGCGWYGCFSGKRDGLRGDLSFGVLLYSISRAPFETKVCDAEGGTPQTKSNVPGNRYQQVW